MDEGNKSTGLVVRQSFKATDILEKALGDIGRPEETLPTEVRRVRRGKFFLSNYEQRTFGSMRQPIFQYYCHGVVVGETQPDVEKDGIWCFAAHNDFDLIPELQPPSSWPEYIRTPTGWVRKDGDRRLEAPSSTLEKLMDWNMKQLRLK